MLSQNAIIYIADPKENDLYNLRYFLGNEYVASSANNIAKILRIMYEKINERNKLMTRNGLDNFGKDYRDFNLKPIFIIFDEVGVIMNEDPKIAKEINENLTKLINKGRQFGIFVILATQKPDANTINTNIRDQLSLRVSLGKMYKEGLKMTLGDDFDELPAAEQSQSKGFIYIDGEAWSMPRAYRSPLFKNNEIDLFKALTKYN